MNNEDRMNDIQIDRERMFQQFLYKKPGEQNHSIDLLRKRRKSRKKDVGGSAIFSFDALCTYSSSFIPENDLSNSINYYLNNNKKTKDNSLFKKSFFIKHVLFFIKQIEIKKRKDIIVRLIESVQLKQRERKRKRKRKEILLKA